MVPSSSKQTEEAEVLLQTDLQCESVNHSWNLVCSSLDLEAVYELVKNSDDEIFSGTLNSTIKVLEQCCELYQFQDILLSFNGGKDCTLLVHLAHAVFKRKYPDLCSSLQTLYIQYDDPFPETELFIEDSVKRYNLDLTTVQAPVKQALEKILSEKPHIKVILMGTRRTDPYSSSLSYFQMTDASWPQVMRCSPLLDWNYQDVWTFILKLDVPFCSLYENGYTSLGSRQRTQPNPSLKYTNADGQVQYHPAHLLQDNDKERDGRQ